ncbi:MAG: MFS transporter [Bdellovibrionales bacterium]|nr:MFS transporter [Bdellovibrionales bacterium]
MSKRPIFVIFLTVFIDLVGFGIIIPLSPYLARTFGATPFEIGLLMAVYSAMQFLFSPFWGRISDRVGRRPILLLSIAGTGLAHLLFYYADHLWILFLARTLAGVFGANISTAMAYIADITSEKDRSKSMGLIGAAFGLGFICGPALGGVTSAFGENFPALIATGLSFLNFTMALFILKESLSPEKRQKRAAKSRIKNILEKIKQPVVGALLFAQFSTALAMANMEASMFLYVKDKFYWDVKTASYGFAYVGVCIAFTQGVLVRKLMPRYGERILLVAGFIFFTLGMFVIGLSDWVWLLAIAMTSLALGNGMINPSVTGGLSLLTPPTEQGEIIGVNHSLAALARIIGPAVGGYIYMHISMSSPFYLAAGLGVAGLLFVWKARNSIPNAGKVIPS